MGRKKSLQKSLRPTFHVFCEGKTEEIYVQRLRQYYRIPIEIKTKVSGLKISQRDIKKYLKSQQRIKQDKIFLLYDLDVPEILGKLSTIKNAILLVSNPCIELWFLLHFQSQNAALSSKSCIAALLKQYPQYQKDKLDQRFFQLLLEKQNLARERAKQLNSPNNPSSTLFEFLTALEIAQA